MSQATAIRRKVANRRNLAALHYVFYARPSHPRTARRMVTIDRSLAPMSRELKLPAISSGISLELLDFSGAGTLAAFADFELHGVTVVENLSARFRVVDE